MSVAAALMRYPPCAAWLGRSVDPGLPAACSVLRDRRTEVDRPRRALGLAA